MSRAREVNPLSLMVHLDRTRFRRLLERVGLDGREPALQAIDAAG